MWPDEPISWNTLVMPRNFYCLGAARLLLLREKWWWGRAPRKVRGVGESIKQTMVLGLMLGNRGFPEAWSRLCVCQASFLMTLAMSGVPHSGPGTWDFPGKTIGVGCHFLHQGIFPTQGIKPRSPTLQAETLYPLSHRGSLLEMGIQLLFLLTLQDEETVYSKHFIN